jgi:hypothetical protein
MPTDDGPPGPNRKIASGYRCRIRSKNGAQPVVETGQRTASTLSPPFS